MQIKGEREGMERVDYAIAKGTSTCSCDGVNL